MHDEKRNVKVKLKEISLKAIFMQYYRDPDSVVLAMIDMKDIK